MILTVYCSHVGQATKSVSCSGDGQTVPYWSLQHAQEWAGQCDVLVDEIHGAYHRKIMDADKRFHAVVLLGLL